MVHYYVSQFSSKSPFYRLARNIRLGFIDKGILSNHPDDRFKQLKISVPNSFSEKIVEYTLGHPYKVITCLILC